MNSPFAQKSALITGASAGLGEEFARQLAELGVIKIILTARRLDRLEALQKSLKAAYPLLEVESLAADLSLSADLNLLIQALEGRNFHPDILINNAGLGDLGTFESSAPEKIESMLAVNVVALTRLTRWALPAMLAKRSGFICNVGSTAGVVPFIPTFAVYGGTKAYVNSFTEALRIELLGSGVQVNVLAPGPVETEFGSVASRANSSRKFAAPPFLYVDKKIVVQEALSGLARNQARVIPGLLLRLSSLLFIEPTPLWILRLVFGAQASAFQKERAEREQQV